MPRNELVVLRLETGEELSRFRFGLRRGGPAEISFVSDEHLVVVAESGALELWDVETARRVRQIGEHDTADLAVSPDGTRLASAGFDQSVKIWDIANAPSEPRILRGHGGGVLAVEFLDNDLLISSGQDAQVRLWNLRKSPASDERWPLPQDTLNGYLRDGILAADLPNNRMEVWDTSHIPEPVAPRPASLPPALRHQAIRIPGSDYTIVFPRTVRPRPGWGLAVQLYRGMDKPELVKNFPEFGMFGPRSIDRSRGLLYLHGVVQGVQHLLVWDLSEEKQAHLIPTTLRAVSAMAIASNQQLVFLGDEEGKLECVDLASGTTTLLPSAVPEYITALAVLPDNRTVLASGFSRALRKIDWLSRTSIEVPGNLRPISAMAVSPSGNRLVTGDAQGAVRLWDIETLREIAVIGTHKSRVGGVQFQPDGKTLLTVDAKELRIWRGDGR